MHPDMVSCDPRTFPPPFSRLLTLTSLNSLHSKAETLIIVLIILSRLICYKMEGLNVSLLFRLKTCALYVSLLFQGSHSDHWYTSIREIRATNSTTIHTTGCTTEVWWVCFLSLCLLENDYSATVLSKLYVFVSFFVCVCIAEAEELNNRLQSTKQRVSELERTLSSISTQQKQCDKVIDITGEWQCRCTLRIIKYITQQRMYLRA